MNCTGEDTAGNITDNSYYDYNNYDFNDTYDIVEPCLTNNNYNVELVVRPYIHSIICILGFIGNSLVIVTYAFYKRTKSMTDVYLLNVAIADMLFVLALPLIIYNEENGWAMGSVACKLLRGAYSINLYSCMLLLACISTDRYLAIVQARRSFSLRSRSLIYSRIICSLVWALALVLSVPTFLYYDSYLPSHSTEEYDEHVCEFRFQNNETAHQMKVLVPSSQIAVGFVLPLLIMGFCYTSIIVTLMHAKNFQRHKAVRVVIAVVVVFIACHLPYNVALLYDTVNIFKTQECEAVDSTHLAKTVTAAIAYLHCCLNPVLYAFVGVKFRNHFRKIVEDLWCLGKRYINPHRFSRVTSEIYVSSRRSVDGSNDNGSSFTM